MYISINGVKLQRLAGEPVNGMVVLAGSTEKSKINTIMKHYTQLILHWGQQPEKYISTLQILAKAMWCRSISRYR